MTLIDTDHLDHGIVIEYHYDDGVCDMNPRTEYDNVGRMVCQHRRYTLGDAQRDPGDSDTETLADFIREVIRDEERDDSADVGAIALPLWLYDHSGITMSVGSENLLADDNLPRNPFSCPWDSGMVGFIYVTAAKVKEEWGGDTDKAIAYLVGEVNTYDLYLRGEVYGYVIESEDGEHLDSCWGFLGGLNIYSAPDDDDNYVKAEAHSQAAWWVEVAEWHAAVVAAEEAADLLAGTPLWVAA